MDRYLIVADDITGANDTGVQLTRYGITTIVTLWPEGIINDQNSYVLDTESRSLGKQAAYDKLKSQLGEVDISQFKYMIKKVDSTLRGNIAQEVLAMDEIMKSELVIFMPALPDLARTTEQNIHMLNGTPITQTELAKDPKTPVTEDNIQKILQSVYDEPVICVFREDILSGNLDFTQNRIYAVDAVTNLDMKTVVQSAIATGKRILWVGTAAIADNLLAAQSIIHPAFGLVGSVSNVSREQIHHAEQEGVAVVTLPVHKLLNNEDASEYINQAVGYLKDGRDTLVVSAASYDRDNMEKSTSVGKELGLSPEEVSHKVQDILGAVTVKILKNAKISGMFLTGGDTAISVFEKLGVVGNRIQREVLLGIPLMHLVGGDFEGLSVVTKAGAFGQKDAINYIFRKLKEKESK